MNVWSFFRGKTRVILLKLQRSFALNMLSGQDGPPLTTIESALYSFLGLFLLSYQVHAELPQVHAELSEQSAVVHADYKMSVTVGAFVRWTCVMVVCNVCRLLM